MSGVNKVILVGRLGDAPEIKYLDGEKCVANFSLATSESWKDKNGDKQEKTEWHKIVAWGRLAEVCAEYLTKGKQIYAEGSIGTEKWQDKEGNDRYTAKITISTMQMLGSKGDDVQESKSEPSVDSGDVPY